MARRPLRNAALVAGASMAFAACSLITPFDDRTRDFGVTDGSADEDGAVTDAAAEAPAPGDDASCRQLKPAEGTYAYSPRFVEDGGDSLTLGSTPITTQPWRVPFFGTVRHTADPACWIFGVEFANADAGSHLHTWTFCNRCVGDAGGLEVTAETDDLRVKALSLDQHTAYSCGSPNLFHVDGLEVDATIPQATCSGTTAGGVGLNVLVNPVSYRFSGPATTRFASQDASFPGVGYRQELVLALADAGNSTPGAIDWTFDPTTGLPMASRGTRSLNLSVATDGGIAIFYAFALNYVRDSANVSPLPPVVDQ